MSYRTHKKTPAASKNNGKSNLLQPSLSRSNSAKKSTETNNRSSREARPATIDRRVIPGLQAKMIVGEVNSPLEREADQVAERVMSMSTPLSLAGGGSTAAASNSGKIHRKCSACGKQMETVQRKCAGCAGKEDEKMQRRESKSSTIQRETLDEEEPTETLMGKMQPNAIQRTANGEDEETSELMGKMDPTIRREANPEEEDLSNPQKMEEEADGALLKKSGSQGNVPTVSPGTESSIRSMRNSGGSPLPASEMSFFGDRMGPTAETARIHTGSAAAQAATDVGARAFTLGNDVFFNKGEYQPGTPGGRSLLAHELAHVGQNQAGGTAGVVSREVIRRQENSEFSKTQQGKTDSKKKTDVKDVTYDQANAGIKLKLDLSGDKNKIKLTLDLTGFALTADTYHNYLFTNGTKDNPHPKMFRAKMMEEPNATTLKDLPYPVKIAGREQPLNNPAEFLNYSENHFQALVKRGNAVERFNAFFELNRSPNGFNKKSSFPLQENSCLFVDKSGSMDTDTHRRYLAWKVKESLGTNVSGVGDKKISIFYREFDFDCKRWSKIPGKGLGTGEKGDGGLIRNVMNKVGVSQNIHENPGAPSSSDDCFRIGVSSGKEVRIPQGDREIFQPGECAWKTLRDKECRNIILFTDLRSECYADAIENTGVPIHVEKISP